MSDEEQVDKIAEADAVEPASPELWFYGSDSSAEEWFGPFPTMEGAIEKGRFDFVGMSFVVCPGSMYTEEIFDDDVLDDLLEVFNLRFEGLGGDSDACKISEANRVQALLDVKDWLRRWCKPQHLVVDGESVNVDEQGNHE